MYLLGKTKAMVRLPPSFCDSRTGEVMAIFSAVPLASFSKTGGGEIKLSSCSLEISSASSKFFCSFCLFLFRFVCRPIDLLL